MADRKKGDKVPLSALIREELMPFWQDIKVGILSGIAFRKYLKQRYQEAARLFERICKLESGEKQSENIYSYLGRCYVFLGKYDDAVNALSKADDLFNERDKEMKEDFDKEEYREFLKAYSYALHKIGQVEKSIKVKERILKHA